MAPAGDVRTSRARAGFTEYWPLALLVMVAAAISVAVHHFVFPAYSWNRDEVVYLWQVQGLAEGKVFTSGGGTPLFFQPWLSGVSNGMFFSQYTLGWPLVLLVAQWLGATASALAFATALAVLGTYAFAREVTRDRWVALVAAAVLVLSPVVVVQSGMYLSYLFALGLGALFGAGLLAGLRRRSRWLLLAAGACVGWLFMTRPFDAVLWGGALVAYVVFANWHEKARVACALAWTALGALPLLIATLAYNKHITGSFTEFPITAADPRDTFGFGKKSIGERWPTLEYTLRRAVRGVGRNGWELPPFLFGSYVGLVLAAIGLWLRRHQRSTLALLAVVVVFPLGYFFFWGISLSATFAHVSGPLYFVPLFLPASVLIATTMCAAWRRSHVLALGVTALLVLATVPFMVNRIDVNHSISEAQVPWRDATSQFHGRSLVIIDRSGPYLLHLNPFSDNPPDLDGRILYTTDRGSQNLELLARHPERRAYFEATNLTIAETLADFSLPVPTITVTPISVKRSSTLTVRATVTATNNDPVVAATLRVGDHIVQQVLSTHATKGETFTAEWHIATPSAVATDAGAIPFDVAAAGLSVDAGSGVDASAVLTVPSEQIRFAARARWALTPKCSRRARLPHRREERLIARSPPRTTHHALRGRQPDPVTTGESGAARSRHQPTSTSAASSATASQPSSGTSPSAPIANATGAPALSRIRPRPVAAPIAVATATATPIHQRDTSAAPTPAPSASTTTATVDGARPV